MRSKKDILLVICFTILILSLALIAQTGLAQITGYAAGGAEVCIGNTPSLVPIVNLTSISGILFEYDVNHTVANDDSVEYSDTSDFFVINPTTGNISLTPEHSDVGNYTIMIIVNNSACPLLGDLEELTFEIMQGNRPPILETIGNHTVLEDESLEIDVNATDPDGDDITYACNDTTYFTIDEITGVIEWDTTNDDVGLHWFDCNATDEFGLYDSETFSIEVINVNDAPIFLDNTVNFTVLYNNPLYENTTFYAEINATDPDGDDIEFLDNWTNPRFVIGTETGIISFTPTHLDVGNHSVEIYAVDGQAMAVEVFLFEILAINDPPVLSPLGAQTAEATKAFYLDVNATDEEDGDDNLDGTGNLTFFLNDTTLFDINSTTGVISFIPAESDVGSYSINVSVTDKGIPSYGLGNATDSEVISFVVTIANRPPNITSYSPETPFTMQAGQSQDFVITAEDPDGGTPSAQWYLDIVLIDGSTEYTYTFTPPTAGTYNLTVVISDGEFEDLQEWSITATPAPTPPPAPSVGGAGGRYFCKEVWVCTDWSTCMITDIQIRECKDILECGTTLQKPPQIRSCIFAPIETCFDGIRNQNEILTDCGGVCPSCPHCSDMICNQGEQCERCDEDPSRCPRDLEGNIMPDCGGPCPLCPKIEKPLKPKGLNLKKIMITIIKVTLGIIFLLLILLIIFIKIIRKMSKKDVMTEQEKAEINLVKEINNLIKYAEKAVDKKDLEHLKLICANIENLYNNLSNRKNKKKIYPKIKRLKRAIRVGL